MLRQITYGFLLAVTVSFSLLPLRGYADVSATTTVSITAIVPSDTSQSSNNNNTNNNTSNSPSSGFGGGGAGIGGLVNDVTSNIDTVVFKGLAYPGSIVTLIKNGAITAEVPASPTGIFEIHVKNLNPGTYSFGVRAEDADHLKSNLDLYTVYVASGITTVVDGLFIPPTISSDKTQVRQGEILTLFGKSAPSANLTLSIHSANEIVKKVKSTDTGAWIYKLDSSELELGKHEGKVRAATENDLSLYSEPLPFTVGDTNIERPKATRSGSSLGAKAKCDLNEDGRVNLLDFSIMAFWYKRTGFPAKIDLSGDGKVNLTDLSILAYCWTG